MFYSKKLKLKIVTLITVMGLTACDQSANLAAEKAKAIDEAKLAVITVANTYLSGIQQNNPTIAYYANYIGDSHGAFRSNKPEDIRAWEAKEDGYLASLLSINYDVLKGSKEAILYAQMQEKLEARVGERVCKKSLWDINHMGGLHSGLGRLAKFQPVGNDVARQEAVARWTAIAAYFDQEILNLSAGRMDGYLAPKAVVERVIKQVNGLIVLPEDQSPLFDPITRDDDAAFNATYLNVINNKLIPALKAYQEFLSVDYMADARDSRALINNPKGKECFEALYRSYTTLKWSAQKVHDLGAETVNKYKAQVIELGNKVYGLNDMPAILKRNSEDPDNRFDSLEEMHTYYEAVVKRVEEGSKHVFEAMPKTKLDVIPYPDYLAGTGVSARYEAGGPGRNGIFRYDPTSLVSESKGGAEIVSVHEGYPGHHMQIALVQDLPELHPIQRLTRNSAFVEGWGRYSEALTEELGLYETDFAKITRRAWPARGMVVDTGLHVLGWSEEQALAFLAESGRMMGASGVRMIDRIASIPAQLTSYDSGAIEIFALRQQAKDALGEKFDLKKFHTIILKNGVVPLWVLREQVENWIMEEQTS